MKRKTIENGISPPYILLQWVCVMHGHMLLSSQPLNALKDPSSMGLRSRKVRTCKCILWVQILHTGFRAATTCKGHFTSNNSSVLRQNFQPNTRLVLDSFLSIILLRNFCFSNEKRSAYILLLKCGDIKTSHTWNLLAHSCTAVESLEFWAHYG